nr:transcription initiation factor TFIIB [Marseillevirus futianmevirus]
MDFSEFPETVEDCSHKNIEEKKGNRVCLECFQILDGEISYTEKDSATFGPKRSCAGRLTTRGEEKRNIFKDLEFVQLPENVMEAANAMYQKIMEKEGGESSIKRGKKRKGVIIVCTQKAFKQYGEHRSVYDVAEQFGETRKGDISYGLKKYCKVFRESLTEYTKPADLVRRIVTKCGIPFGKYEEIYQMCLSVQGKTRMLKSAVPQSVASAVVFLWQTIHKEHQWACYTNKKDFAKIVGLSEATITKHAKEVAKILELDDVKV